MVLGSKTVLSAAMATSVAGTGAVSRHGLRLCSFNVLAPSARICAPLDRQPWENRHSKICDQLLQLDADLVCLQEFDFAPSTSGFTELYQDKLGAAYDIFTKRRTGAKNDGLAMLIRKASFREVEVRSFPLEPAVCDRVAMLARLEHVGSGCRLAFANTHLTVAHADNSHDIPRFRPQQMEQVLQMLEAAGEADGVVLCADMNSDHLEERKSGRYSAEEVNRPVHMAFERGFDSSLHRIHPGIRPISHTCSYAHDGCADYILFRTDAKLALKHAFLHPAELAQDTPWSSSTGWGDIEGATLSDHRPVVADFWLSV